MKNFTKNDKKLSENELEFAVFCIENIAKRLGISGADAYNLLSRKSRVLWDYIIPCSDILHTQDKEYIVNDILGVLEKEGVKF